MYKWQLRAFFGNQKKAAKEIGISEMTISAWPDPIPRLWALDISDRFKDEVREGGLSLNYDREIYLKQISELSERA